MWMIWEWLHKSRLNRERNVTGSKWGDKLQIGRLELSYIILSWKIWYKDDEVKDQVDEK